MIQGNIMKKNLFFVKIIIVVLICAGLCSCGESHNDTDIWKDAVYTADTELGSGEKTLEVQVVALDNSITFTIHSDKETVGEALTEHKLIEGERGSYGIYVKKVNGITADYDTDKTYWAFTKNGESMMTGVDGAEFKDGEHYELVYTK